MKTFTVLAALAVAFAVSAPGFAQDTTTSPQTGHWEWRSQPSYGPRAPLRAPVRVWVPANAAAASGQTKSANCDCAMMHASAENAADCMKMDKPAN